MMKLSHLLRACVPCLLLAVTPLLSHCGEAAGFGTETGNPPQLEEMKLYLEIVPDGIRVVGAPGAVAPPGAAVRVTNVSTGVSVETAAAADGSLDVVVPGEGGDEFEVTVTSGGREASERVSFGAVLRRTDLSAVSCSGLESTVFQTVGDVLTSADVACSADVDCVFVGHGVRCYPSCASSVVSRDGAVFVSSEGERLTGAVCAALDACDRVPPPSCDLPDPLLPLCVAGRCEAVGSTSLACNDLLDAAEARRAQLRARAPKACVADADCGLARVATRCTADCGRIYEGVALGAVEATESAVRDEIDVTYCEPAMTQGCSIPDCGNEPEPAEAYCDAGSCAVSYNGEGRPCTELLQGAEERRSELRSGADKACAVDADCALAEVSVSCLRECGGSFESVALAAAQGLETTVRAEVESAYCEPFADRGCSLPDLSCPEPSAPEAFCDAGACGLRFAD